MVIITTIMLMVTTEMVMMMTNMIMSKILTIKTKKMLIECDDFMKAIVMLDTSFRLLRPVHMMECSLHKK